MEKIILVRENTSWDKLVDVVAGSFATLSAVVVGGASLYMTGQGCNEYIPHLVLTTPLLFAAGQQFYTPTQQENSTRKDLKIRSIL